MSSLLKSAKCMGWSTRGGEPLLFISVVSPGEAGYELVE